MAAPGGAHQDGSMKERHVTLTGELARIDDAFRRAYDSEPWRATRPACKMPAEIEARGRPACGRGGCADRGSRTRGLRRDGRALGSVCARDAGRGAGMMRPGTSEGPMDDTAITKWNSPRKVDTG